jgi:anaerobic glycerol-3-phosphate dehydrogenase
MTRGASGARQVKAGAVVLATGGLLNGGLVAEDNGTVRESVFGIPIEAPPRANWYHPLFLDRHPLLEAGIRVNQQMQPVVKEQVLYKGLYAVGGVLRDADRLGEASTQGIDLATAAKAAEVLQV